MRCWPAVMIAIIAGGCQVAPQPRAVDPTSTAQLQRVDSVNALCAPPPGWIADPLKQSDNHAHQIWLSPSKQTAYGVIHFTLPLPVPHDPVLWVFMDQMKRSEGTATLLEQRWDPDLWGIRFTAEGKVYTVRVNLLVRGFEGWAIYAGTLTGKPIDTDELALAEQAREQTIVGESHVTSQ